MLVFGILGMLAGALKPIPQVWKIIKRGRAWGIAKYFILLWFCDNFFTLIYQIYRGDLIMIIKYSTGVICISIIAYYKFKDKIKKYTKAK